MKVKPGSMTRKANRRMSNVEGINKKENRRTVEYRMSNVEGRNSIDFIKKLSTPTFLRHSAVRYSAVLRSLDHVFSVVRFSPVLRSLDHVFSLIRCFTRCRSLNLSGNRPNPKKRLKFLKIFPIYIISAPNFSCISLNCESYERLL